ncbi:PEP-CTERM sorting domain-containing protein [Sphingobium sp.]|uniref:PEP-CTERM sorting domain-containing protein n=1 Tax=Sphingobium sp. TaxID=1912891 RepID=UPI003BB4E1FB
MKINKMFLALGAATMMAAAAPANATWGCWFSKKCGGGSSSGGTSSGNPGGSSSGGAPTPVPEPEQMALFGMGVAVLAGRIVLARRKRK